MTFLKLPEKAQNQGAPTGSTVQTTLRASVWRDLRWLLFFSIAANLLLLTLPLHMIAVYDRVLVSRSSETLFYVTLVALGALVLLGITEAVRMMIAQRMSARYVTGVAGPLFSALVHEEDTDAPRSQLMRDFYALRSFLASKALIGLFDVPFAPLFLILLFVLHVQLGLVTLAGMLVLAGLALANRRMSAEMSEAATRSNADAVSFSQAVVSRPEDIRAMGLFTPFLSRWGSKMDTALTKADETARIQAIFFGLSRAIRQSLQIIIMAWGAALVLAGDLSGGIIFAASLISSRAFGPLEQTIGAWDRIDAARKALDNLSEFLDSATAPPQAVIPARTMGDIDVEAASVDVSVGGRRQTILDNVSFSMKSGRILAVVGPSGAGKTTLAKLVAGALKPSVGSVRLDDFELALWPDARRGQSIGYVPQDSRPFPGSIAENISRFEAYPDHDRIIDAAQKAGIHNAITKLPDAYASLVGPDTADLSGGQMQQLALARAYYAQPRVLVLDEPNAHLDTQAEENLLRTLVALREEGVTTVVVSQRRSVLKIANHVLVMNEGKIVSYRENEGEWKERRVDGKPAPPPSNVNAAPGIVPGLAQKPEVTVNTLNQHKPRQKGTVRVESAPGIVTGEPA